MLNRAEIKQDAKKVLMQNKWSFIIFFAVCALVMFLINLIPFLGQLIMLFVTPTVTFITVKVCFEVLDGGSAKDALSHPFTNLSFGYLLKQIGTGLFVGVLATLGAVIGLSVSAMASNGFMAFLGMAIMIATLVVAVYLFYAYSFVPYIAYEQPNLKFFETLNASKDMTNGHKMEIWVLSLSFIGWMILANILSGIGVILGPIGIIIASSLTWGLLSGYMALANASYYYHLSGKATITKVVASAEVVE